MGRAGALGPQARTGGERGQQRRESGHIEETGVPRVKWTERWGIIREIGRPHGGSWEEEGLMDRRIGKDKGEGFFGPTPGPCHCY